MSELVLEREGRRGERGARSAGKKENYFTRGNARDERDGTCRINPPRLAARKLRGERVHGSHPPLYPGVVAERAN